MWIILLPESALILGPGVSFRSKLLVINGSDPIPWGLRESLQGLGSLTSALV